MKLLIIRSLFIFSALIGIAVGANENEIRITANQMQKLGIGLGKAVAVKQIPLLSSPAQVVVPPTHEFIVSAPQSGFVEKLFVAIGDKVLKGQILAQLESPDLLAVQRDYLKALNVLNLASETYQRDKKLMNEGVIAKRRWQETNSQYQSTLSDANSLKQLLEIAGMTSGEIRQLAKTQRLNRQLNIRSPVDGVVLERWATVGTRIDTMLPIYHIANLDELWLEAAIPQERVQDIHIGDRVMVENSDAAAKITLLGQNVNPGNQTVVARALITSDPNTTLRPGQRINVRIIRTGDDRTFKISDSAIIRNEGHDFIFVHNDQGFTATPVNVLGKQDGESVIQAGLNANEQIAVHGSAALKANWLGLGSDE